MNNSFDISQFKKIPKWMKLIPVLAIIIIAVLFAATYTVDEGNVGIVKRFGEAVDQVDPGLHFKLPISDNIVEMDVRTRKYQLSMSVATTGKNKETNEVELQVPSQIIISANWSIPKTSALAIYKEYGGLKEYENKILDPRVLSSAKDVIAQYDIETVISQRQAVTNALVTKLTESLVGFKVQMTDVNLEDIKFPSKVQDAIQKKQVAKQKFQTEEYTLQQQNLVAQQSVNVAKAEAEAITLKANAKASAILAVSKAEAEAIRAKGKALRSNPQIIDLVKAETWNGTLPTHILGNNSSLLFNTK